MVVRRIPVLQADFDSAGLAGGYIGECQELFAALDWASGLLFPFRITFSRLVMFLQDDGVDVALVVVIVCCCVYFY